MSDYLSYQFSYRFFHTFFQYEDYPNMTHHLAIQTLPLPEDSFSANLTWEQYDVLRHTFFPDPDLTRLAGIYKVGVKLRGKRFNGNSIVISYNPDTYFQD